MKFSVDQGLTIRHDDRPHLLVSAAAGAGKTTVMIERIATRLLAGKRSPADLLVMTFSEKAAAQMAERLEIRLQEAAFDPAETRAVEVLEKLNEATVSTIHAFCNRLIGEFSADLIAGDGEPILEPNYSVLEPEEASALLSQAIRSTLDDLYVLASRSRNGELEACRDEVLSTLPFMTDRVAPFTLAEPVSTADWLNDFLTMSAVFSPGYIDDRLEAVLLSVVRQLYSIPEYGAWLKKTFSLKPTASSIQNDPAFTAIFAELDRLTPPALRDLEVILDEPYLEKAYVKKPGKTVVNLVESLRVAKAVLPGLPAALSRTNPNRWNDVRAIGQQLIEIKLPSRNFKTKDGANLRSFYERFVPHLLPLIQIIGGKIVSKAAREAYAPEAEFVFVRSLEAQVEDENTVRPLVLRLFETALLVDRRYRYLKVRQNCVDFSDFEHYALRLLGNNDVAATVQSRYQDVYVDEYQDTSSIQDAVIRKLSTNRVFMVGDVKQSIYRFRHANPSLFLAKAEAYRQVNVENGKIGTDPKGDLLLLNTNYRSRPAILHAVNDVFAVLMQDHAGEIVYDASHRLRPGRTDHSTDDSKDAVELCLVSLPDTLADQGEDDESDLMTEAFTVLDYEAMEAATKIRALLEDGRKAGDIVILGRSHSICAHYYRVLRMVGLPVFGADNDSLFDTWELSLIDSLVALLVNAKQDIPLASLMLSVLAPDPFTEDDLLRMRNLTDAERPFHEAVRLYAEGDGPLANKAADFFKRLDDWRHQSHRFGVYDLLTRIINQTGFIDYVSALPNGPSRVSFLTRFMTWLQANEPGDLRKLVTIIGEMRSRGASLKDFTNDGGNRNLIRIMTMHTSKGLEFKIVFVAGLAKRLTRDHSSRLFLSEDIGITSDYVDPGTGRYFKSMRHAYRENIKAGRQMQEELRLLYVAMTRAEERLYLMASTKKLELLQKAVEKCYRDDDPHTVDFALQQRASSLIVLLLAALRQTYPASVNAWFEGIKTHILAGVVSLKRVDGGRMSLPDRLSDAYQNNMTASGTTDQAPDPARVKKIAAWLDPTVKYADLAVAPSKLTVSELKRQLDRQLTEFDDEENADLPPNDMAYLINRPDTIERDSAKDLGTALHTVFQFLDLKSFVSDPGEAAYKAQLDEMVDKARLTAEDRSRVEPFFEAIASFATSDVAARLMAPGTKVYREMPFTLAVPTRDAPEALTLVQGIIDLWYVTSQGEVGLLDYKSDKLDAPDQEGLTAAFAKRYSIQLDYYAKAIEKATGRTVNWKQIWAIRRAMLLTLS